MSSKHQDPELKSSMDDPDFSRSKDDTDLRRSLDAPDMSNSLDDTLFTNRTVYKNLIVLSITFMFNFTAWIGLSNLQSSLNHKDGLGAISSSLGSGAFALSSLLLPKITVKRFGEKRCIIVAIFFYVVWFVSNGYATWYTLPVTYMIMGTAGGPLWGAQGSYMTRLIIGYAKRTKENHALVSSKLFGIYMTIFFLCKVNSSIISTTILRPRAENASYDSPSDEEIKFCGVNDCPGNNITNINLEKQDKFVVWLLIGVYSLLGIAAMVICGFFLDALPKPPYISDKSRCKQLIKDLSASSKHLITKEQLLLTPLTLYFGYVNIFFSFEYTKSFVTCPYGIWMVGITGIPSDILSLFSFVGGFLPYLIGRMAVMTSVFTLYIKGLMIQLMIFIMFLIWIPNGDDIWVIYIISVLRGIADLFIQPNLSGIYSSLFPKNPSVAFGSLQLIQAISNVIALAYSPFICMSTKLYIILGFFLLCIVTYSILEYLIKQQKIGNGLEIDNEKDALEIKSVEENGIYKIGLVNELFSYNSSESNSEEKIVNCSKQFDLIVPTNFDYNSNQVTKF